MYTFQMSSMKEGSGSRTRAARLAPRALLALAALAACAATAGTSEGAPPYPAASRAVASLASIPAAQGRTALRYDTDYPTLHYGGVAHENAIARLQARLDRGEVQLDFRSPRGYLDSILAALNIDPSSQTLVFSKTSLQIDVIRAATPRAIYFNDDTYIAWVQSSLLEIATMDDDLGPVFYTLVNRRDQRPSFDRDVLRCLACHDTFSLSGGGVPRFLFMSSFVNLNGEGVTNNVSTETTDATPIRDRWGGWYVTGQHGAEVHLGNLRLRTAQDVAHIDQMRHGNILTLDGLFDTRPYLTDKSDIVALLVFEHQAYVQNFITRVNFKARAILARERPADGATAAWDSLSPQVQRALRAMTDPLIRALLLVDAARINAAITSSSGYDQWFEKQGPRDPSGRSLRELDLHTRLFKYPLSYTIYSSAFDHLPACAREYVYTRLAAVLSGRDERTAKLSVADRTAVRDILAATRPEFAQVLAHSPAK